MGHGFSMRGGSPKPGGFAFESRPGDGVDPPKGHEDPVSAAGDGLEPGPIPSGTALTAVRLATRLAATAPPATYSALSEWRGRWVATCIAERGTDLYRGSLTIDGQARFHWVNLSTGASGSVEPLEMDDSGSGGDTVRLLRRSSETSAGDWNRAEGDAAVATLERRATSGRRMIWRAAEAGNARVEGTQRQGLPMQGMQSQGARNPALAGPCAQWRIFPEDGSGDLDGLWVLPPGENSAEGTLGSEYVELRMARKGDGFAGRFVGRYRVPAASMPPEMRFGFQVPSPAIGWHEWESDDGVAGKLLLAPIGRSRLAVVWKRDSIPSGGPRLSGGVAVLRRME